MHSISWHALNQLACTESPTHTLQRLLDNMVGSSNPKALDLWETLMQEIGAACSIPEFEGSWQKITINPPYIPEQADVSTMMDCIR